MTAVGGGEFSSPVTVSLREPSDDSSSNPIAPALTATVIVIVILSLGLVVTNVSTCVCWYVLHYQIMVDIKPGVIRRVN